jgi:hypothetical protein
MVFCGLRNDLPSLIMSLHHALFLAGIAVFLSACAKDPLDELQLAAGKYQTCMVKRTYKDECAQAQDSMETARLTAIKAGSETAQVDAAIGLGVRGVKGASDESPYADFLKRRKEAIAANLIRANADELSEDEALAKTLAEQRNNTQPLSSRQKAEMLLIQSILEEKYPSYFSEPPNGIETDPEILNMVCKDGTPANQSQVCKRFRKP